LSTSDKFSDAYKRVGAEAVAQAKHGLAQQQAEDEAEQLDLWDAPLSASELFAARADAGPIAGLVQVIEQARTGRAGRIKGSRNRRTEDFIKYISQFGSDPAVTLMEIHSQTPEELMARSSMLDLREDRLSYRDAQALRVRCAEALMPFLHSKQPVAIDATIRGVMVVEEITSGIGPMIEAEAEFVPVAAIEEGEP
jgi:hypothetical protein